MLRDRGWCGLGRSHGNGTQRNRSGPREHAAVSVTPSNHTLAFGMRLARNISFMAKAMSPVRGSRDLSPLMNQPRQGFLSEVRQYSVLFDRENIWPREGASEARKISSLAAGSWLRFTMASCGPGFTTRVSPESL